jgi:hypothetical protein
VHSGVKRISQHLSIMPQLWRQAVLLMITIQRD